jgi:hypothetical protein
MLFIYHLEFKDEKLTLPMMALACWVGVFDITNALDTDFEKMVLVMRINLGQLIF